MVASNVGIHGETLGLRALSVRLRLCSVTNEGGALNHGAVRRRPLSGGAVRFEIEKRIRMSSDSRAVLDDGP